MSMQILRIENDYGTGIFRGGDHSYWRELMNRHNDFNTPHQDKLDMHRDSKHWFCAYKSINQIQEWIHKEEFKTIIEKGYKVYLLSVTNYQEGEHQVIFTKDSIVTKEDVSDLFYKKRKTVKKKVDNQTEV